MCSQHYGELLKKHGVLQRSYYHYWHDVDSRLVETNDWLMVYPKVLMCPGSYEADNPTHIASAYSVAELGVMLGKNWEELVYAPIPPSGIVTEADMRAYYLVGVREVNERLTAVTYPAVLL